MKASETFTKTISDHLSAVAAKDPLFAVTLTKPAKNIGDCINYIFETVQKSGCNGFADEEIFAMAIHYYDEDDLKLAKAINAKVVVNRSVAANEAQAATPAPAKKVRKVVATSPVVQSSIFG